MDEAAVAAVRASAGAAWQIARHRRTEWWPFLRERWGWLGPLPRRAGPRVWLVCAPGGEVVQSAALVPALREALPDALLVLSTTNASFLAFARRIAGLDGCLFTPFDRPVPVRRALAAVRPDIVVTVESAFAPVLLREARRAGAITMLASGTMTADYHREPSYARPLRRRVFDDLDLVGVKDEPEIAAFQGFDVPRARMRVLGDLRYDARFYEVGAAERAALRARLGTVAGERLLVAGSVRDGEEAMIVEACRLIRDKGAALRVVIAPRFVTQAPLIERECEVRGLRAGRVSAGTGAGADVIILDSYGDLARVYALADLVFLGGTLVHVGAGLGQNMIEPLAQGAPIFFGPHVRRWTAITAELIRIFPGLAVSGVDDLARGVLELEQAPDIRAALRARAEVLMARGRDATARHVDAIREALAARRSAA
jgi:3-deoxy-D-manno-octulosonic-acid transferase